MSSERPEVRGRRKGSDEFPAKVTISKSTSTASCSTPRSCVTSANGVRADQERRDAAARTEAVLATAADGIVTFDEDMRIESVNRAAARMFACEMDDMIGRSVRAHLLEDEREALHALVETILMGPLPDFPGIERDLVGRRTDGESFPLLASFSEVEPGGHRRFTVIVRDISERRAFEQRIEHHSLTTPGSAATSSSCCAHTSATSERRRTSPAGSSNRCTTRGNSTATVSRSGRASGSPSGGNGTPHRKA